MHCVRPLGRMHTILVNTWKRPVSNNSQNTSTHIITSQQWRIYGVGGGVRGSGGQGGQDPPPPMGQYIISRDPTSLRPSS